jgi:hypothetical protein
MSGRAWVSVLLIATLTGCASRSRPKPCLTRTAHWNALPAFDSTAWWSSEILGGLLRRVGLVELDRECISSLGDAPSDLSRCWAKHDHPNS